MKLSEPRKKDVPAAANTAAGIVNYSIGSPGPRLDAGSVAAVSTRGQLTFDSIVDRDAQINNAGDVTFLRGDSVALFDPNFIPLPASAWMGLALLGGLGVVGVRRKRKRTGQVERGFR